MKKTLYAGLLVLAVLASFQFKTVAKSDKTPLNPTEDGVILLELFTSQGCSSCPPADKLLDKTLAENKNAIGLSYHVDYWNYIGWNDPFSTSEYSNYQRAYASKFQSASIYTPQLVVNGRTHFTGSDNAKVYKRTHDTASFLPKTISLSNVKRAQGKVNLTVSSESQVDLITVVLVIEKRDTEILRGENRNRTLSNSNIVVSRDVMSNTTGSTMTIDIPKLVKAGDKLKLIAFSQNDNLNVISASEVRL